MGKKKKLKKIIKKELPDDFLEKVVWPLLSLVITAIARFIISFFDKNKESVLRPAAERGQTRSFYEQRPPADRAISNPTIQVHVKNALAYKQEIERMVRATTNENARGRLQDLARRVDEWTKAVVELARRLDNFQQNSLIRRDLESVPKSIADLETRLANTTEPVTRTELERTLANRRRQRAGGVHRLR